MALFSHTYSYVNKGDGTAPVNRITLQNLFDLFHVLLVRQKIFSGLSSSSSKTFVFQYLSNTLDCDITK